ncbi:MAG: hypothetical protein QOC98_3257 [Frankiaceae bacterium]|nr:hypothetical protein [Frankiaceae bacterium]
MLSQHLFASSDHRFDAERSLTAHGYDTWCGDIGGRYSVLVVDHPDAYLDRVNNLIRKACPTMPGPGLGESSDTLLGVGLARPERLRRGMGRSQLRADNSAVARPLVPVQRQCGIPEH